MLNKRSHNGRKGIYHFQVDESGFYTLLRVWETGNALLNDLEEFLKGFGLSHGRFSILLTLYQKQVQNQDSGKAVAPSKIAGELKKQRPTISGMLRKLVDDKLVAEIPDSGDGRKKLLKLNSRGFKLLERIIPQYNKRIACFAGNLSEEERIQLRDLLAKIRI